MLKFLNESFTLYLVFPFILLLGIYLTLRLRFVQVKKLPLSFSLLVKKKEQGEEGNISHYQAVSSILAGNLGTGNISGMAIALATGGPGALVWMWIMAFFGAAIQYASCLVGVKYRQKNHKGEYVGGPMYYLSKGLGYKSLAVLFSLALIFGAFAVGNLAQVNSITLPLVGIGLPAYGVGIAIAIFVGLVILGGAQRFAHVSSAVVPVMAVLYLGTASVILYQYADQILPAFQIVWRCAWGAAPVAGGVAGFTIMKALTTGFDRAVFATDAGTGIVPVLQAGARTRSPVMAGVVALVSPFMVMVVCTTTALVLIVTGAHEVAGLKSTNMVAYAFESGVGRPLGSAVVIISLVLFGYTTTLAWASCLQRAVEFLFGTKWIRPFQLLYILVVPAGAIMHVDYVWILADISLSFMLVLNLIGIAGLAKETVSDSRMHFSKEETLVS